MPRALPGLVSWSECTPNVPTVEPAILAGVLDAATSAKPGHFVRELYFIECDVDCLELRYLPALQATMFHFAATQPGPVMEFKGIWFGAQNFKWQFTRPRTSARRLCSPQGQCCKASKSSR